MRLAGSSEDYFVRIVASTHSIISTEIRCLLPTPIARQTPALVAAPTTAQLPRGSRLETRGALQARLDLGLGIGLGLGVADHGANAAADCVETRMPRMLETRSSPPRQGSRTRSVSYQLASFLDFPGGESLHGEVPAQLRSGVLATRLFPGDMISPHGPFDDYEWLLVPIK
jgi:hypothetical protein